MPDYFSLGDTNKDGSIDYKEFCTISSTFGLPLDTTKVHTIFPVHVPHCMIVLSARGAGPLYVARL